MIEPGKTGAESPSEMEAVGTRAAQPDCSRTGGRETAELKMELRESEERLALAITGSKAGVWDLEYTVEEPPGAVSEKVYISPEFKRLLGYEGHEFPSTLDAWRAHVLPEDVARVAEAGRDLLEGLTDIHEVEYRVRHKDGSIRWMNSRGKIWREGGGRVTRWSGINWDITERKRAEEELKRLVAILEETPDLIATADVKGNVLYFNKSARDALGIGADEKLTNTRACQFYPAWVKEILEQEALPVALEEGAWYGNKTSILGKGNKEIAVSQVVLSHKDSHGEVKYLSTIVRDISRLKRAEEDLRKSEERYRQLSEKLEAMVKEQVSRLRQAESMAAVGQTVSTVAHEIRNPLTNITMGLDTLMKMVEEDAEKLGICEEIKYGVDILRGLVDELLDYSRPVKLQLAYRSIETIVKESLRRIAVKRTGVVTSVELEQPNRRIPLDPEKMIRVLVNLFQNAIEAMPQGGTLKVASKYADDSGKSMLALLVSDNGVGMDEKTIEKIQTPFFSTKSKGTGLGLAMCRKIIMAHNGSLSIRSEPSQGTTIEIALPCEPACL